MFDEKALDAIRAELDPILPKGVRAVLCIMRDEDDGTATAILTRDTCMHDFALAIETLADAMADAACENTTSVSHEGGSHGPS